LPAGRVSNAVGDLADSARTTIAALRLNSFAEEGFEKHECVPIVATKSEV
jgi:hypothetical protein